MEQSRRQFFRSMIGGVAAGAAVRSWPFRTFFFPKDIVIGETLWCKAPLALELENVREQLPDLIFPVPMVKHSIALLAQWNACDGELGRGNGSRWEVARSGEDVRRLQRQGYQLPSVRRGHEVVPYIEAFGVRRRVLLEP